MTICDKFVVIQQSVISADRKCDVFEFVARRHFNEFIEAVAVKSC